MLGDQFLMFDPFEKRISRDIRNELSCYFIDLLIKKNRTVFKTKTAALKLKAPDTDHIRYIDERVVKYGICFRRVDAGPFEIARLLWNQELFFECHEWLEPLWLATDGTEKKAIQGIIRAAGAHVLDEAGRKSGSQSSARKALVLIRDHKADIPAPFNPEELIKDLKQFRTAAERGSKRIY